MAAIEPICDASTSWTDKSCVLLMEGRGSQYDNMSENIDAGLADKCAKWLAAPSPENEARKLLGECIHQLLDSAEHLTDQVLAAVAEPVEKPPVVEPEVPVEEPVPAEEEEEMPPEQEEVSVLVHTGRILVGWFIVSA